MRFITVHPITGKRLSGRGMRGVLDLTGQQFGRVTVVALDETRNGSIYWRCICSCGNTTVARSGHLRSGKTTSCGCFGAAIRMANLTRQHDKVRTVIRKWSAEGLPPRPSKMPEYRAWKNMLRRCLNPRDISYKNYGGRGITVCEHWRASFANFYADMGPRPTPDLSIDRIDNGQGYFPGNVRWATGKQQIANQRPRKTRA